ncbi:MAG: ExbD/TolR family protein [Gammaproteobacteria bacterium]|nr:ExbD/TolR family protein [Gammaproteobacteria bacterium]NNC97167.1 ExbD/TolR family protein [Gammaproteobacteria bacterium]NNM13640.1 ExbD/TolR family protein [Gammaproteobacteria bacterium]
MGEINVVPYIDVMLVLLIIFMITAPLLTQGVEVDLPQTEADPIDQNSFNTDNGFLTLTIDSGGAYYLNLGDEEQAIDEQTVRLRSAAALRRNPNLPVFVRADTSVPHGYVVNAMVILQGAGAAKVGIMTDPPDK